MFKLQVTSKFTSSVIPVVEYIILPRIMYSTTWYVISNSELGVFPWILKYTADSAIVPIARYPIYIELFLFNISKFLLIVSSSSSSLFISPIDFLQIISYQSLNSLSIQNVSTASSTRTTRFSRRPLFLRNFATFNFFHRRLVSLPISVFGPSN